MRHIAHPAAAALLAAAVLSAAAPAAAQPLLVGVVQPRTATPADPTYALVLMQPFGDRDKDVCEHFVGRYGAAVQPPPATYRVYWPAPAPRELTRSDCAATPPVRGVAGELYDYPGSPELIRKLRLPANGGPYIVVVQCDPDGASLVNAGYIDLGAAPAAQLPRKFSRFEAYLAEPKHWGKKRRIDRDGVQGAMDLVRAPARIVGRNTGLIKRMHACAEAS